MKNLLLQQVDYKVDETPLGVWRRYLYPDGQLFEEFVSHQRIVGLPLLHYTRGKCPDTGKRIVATGIIAIGRLAVGVVALGQASAGIVAVGQLALGMGLGIGQAATGVAAVGQLALGAAFGFGQIATGRIAVGQFAVGRYVLAQLGFGSYVWDTRGASPVAQRFFRRLLPW